jgi:hypothetical protein
VSAVGAIYILTTVTRHRRPLFEVPDHALKRDESLLEAARYIVANPLRAGLAEQAGEYPYAWCRGL